MFKAQILPVSLFNNKKWQGNCLFFHLGCSAAHEPYARGRRRNCNPAMDAKNVFSRLHFGEARFSLAGRKATSMRRFESAHAIAPSAATATWPIG